MEPGEFDPQFETPDEPQLDAPMDYEMDSLIDQEDELDMAPAEEPPAQGRSLTEWFSDWRVLAAGAFVIGWVVGLYVFGYWLTPLEWTDAGIQHLRVDLQEDYVRMVVDAYSVNDNQDIAMQRLNELGFEDSVEILAVIASNPGSRDIDKVQQLIVLVNQGAGGELLPEGVDGQSPGANDGATLTAGVGGLLLACTLLGVLAVVAAGVFYFRRRLRKKDPTAIMQAVEITRQAPQTDYVAMGESPPISQWMTTYLIGDDLFDDSFSIDTPAGEFMGECGVGIADTIGVGEPKRVSGYEIWLFDKNDIQTVTKVLMSEHAFGDDAIRERLSAKGDPEMAMTGHEVILETQTLQMVARVVDMSYGSGALPDNSFFERVTIELAIWQK